MKAYITSRNFLDLFDSLPEKEKTEIAAAVIQRTAMSDLPELSDNDFTLAAEEIFLNLDNEEG